MILTLVSACATFNRPAEDEKDTQNYAKAKEEYQKELNDDYDESKNKDKKDVDVDVESKHDLKSEIGKALQNNDYRTVKQMAAKILARDPSNLQALNSLAVMAFREQKYGVAKMFWQKALQKHDNVGALYNNLAVLAILDKEDNDAIGLLKKAIASGGNNQAAYANLGSLYLKYNNYAAANDALSKAYSGRLKNKTIANNYAAALYGSDEPDKAIDMMDEIYNKNDEKSIDISLNYASILIHSGQNLSKATQILDRVKILSVDPQVLVKISRLRKQLEKTESAMKDQSKGPKKEEEQQ